MAMTNDDWKEVNELFDTLFGSAELLCDGYKVTLQLRKIERLKLVVMVFIDGKFKGEWMMKECVIRTKFFRKSESYAYSKRHRERALKVFGKRIFKENNYDKKFSTYYPYWTSFRSLKKHFETNIKDIKLINSTTI
jgi:hypothetical protein